MHQATDTRADAGRIDVVPLLRFSEKHEDNHRPALHKGLVIKYNANQRYATTAITASILREVARKADMPLQVSALIKAAGKASAGCAKTQRGKRRQGARRQCAKRRSAGCANARSGTEDYEHA